MPQRRSRPQVPEFILTYSCPDQVGLVNVVANWLYQSNCNIIDSDQFGDAYSKRFFMRVHFSGSCTEADLRDSFGPIGEKHEMEWALWPQARKSKVLIMVSKQDHCLRDLLYRVQLGELPIDVDLVISNHRDAYPLVAADGIDFLHLPVTSDTKQEVDNRLLQEVEDRGIDFVVLARYMQVISGNACRRLEGRMINIHHSFLPGFKGAKPYHQAHDRGVKLIGATAHYVTDVLDEGPIIEQAVERVDHRASPDRLVAIGRDVERQVLARAVRYQAEHRILRNGHRTVVFQ